ncbi:hypothetical protein B0H13DRAFT_2277490 [Mycena leptocephala]|nr:hypothetical protein B0H13DRAFT_2277490 [Mycena leptocephala]
MACIDLGVEPAHMADFFSIFMNDSMDTANMKGMLQVNVFTPQRLTRWRTLCPSVWIQYLAPGAGKCGPDVLGGKFRWAHGVRERGKSAVDYLHSTYHADCDGSGPQVSAVVQYTSQLMGPLLIKALISFANVRTAAKAAGVEPANIGHGIGMASGLLIVIVLASICQHQFFFHCMISGVLARTTLTGALYRAPHPRARLHLPNSAVLNHVSTDVSRVDACTQWFHTAWTAPIQTTVCLIILFVELGPSALAGYALFLVIPLQERIMTHQFALRQGSMKWTDERAGRVLEVVASPNTSATRAPSSRASSAFARRSCGHSEEPAFAERKGGGERVRSGFFLPRFSFRLFFNPALSSPSECKFDLYRYFFGPGLGGLCHIHCALPFPLFSLLFGTFAYYVIDLCPALAGKSKPERSSNNLIRGVPMSALLFREYNVGLGRRRAEPPQSRARTGQRLARGHPRQGDGVCRSGDR